MILILEHHIVFVEKKQNIGVQDVRMLGIVVKSVNKKTGNNINLFVKSKVINSMINNKIAFNKMHKIIMYYKYYNKQNPKVRKLNGEYLILMKIIQI